MPRHPDRAFCSCVVNVDACAAFVRDGRGAVDTYTHVRVEYARGCAENVNAEPAVAARHDRTLPRHPDRAFCSCVVNVDACAAFVRDGRGAVDTYTHVRVKYPCGCAENVNTVPAVAAHDGHAVLTQCPDRAVKGNWGDRDAPFASVRDSQGAVDRHAHVRVDHARARTVDVDANAAVAAHDGGAALARRPDRAVEGVGVDVDTPSAFVRHGRGAIGTHAHVRVEHTRACADDDNAIADVAAHNISATLARHPNCAVGSTNIETSFGVNVGHRGGSVCTHAHVRVEHYRARAEHYEADPRVAARYDWTLPRHPDVGVGGGARSENTVPCVGSGEGAVGDASVHVGRPEVAAEHVHAAAAVVDRDHDALPRIARELACCVWIHRPNSTAVGAFFDQDAIAAVPCRHERGVDAGISPTEHNAVAWEAFNHEPPDSRTPGGRCEHL